MKHPSQYPILIKAEDLATWLLGHTAKFPRAHRGGLSARIDGCAVDLLTHLARAAGSARRRTHWLAAASEELDALRILVRLAMRLTFLSRRQYAYFAEQTDELGRMLGGWMKTKDPE